jgi:uncharacterized membrane protein
MSVLWVIVIPIIVVVVGAALYDLRQRRRRAAVTGHDIAGAVQRGRADRDGRIDSPGGAGGPMT